MEWHGVSARRPSSLSAHQQTAAARSETKLSITAALFAQCIRLAIENKFYHQQASKFEFMRRARTQLFIPRSLR